MYRDDVREGVLKWLLSPQARYSRALRGHMHIYCSEEILEYMIGLGFEDTRRLRWLIGHEMKLRGFTVIRSGGKTLYELTEDGLKFDTYDPYPGTRRKYAKR